MSYISFRATIFVTQKRKRTLDFFGGRVDHSFLPTTNVVLCPISCLNSLLHCRHHASPREERHLVPVN